MEEQARTIVKYLLKNLPSCLESSTEKMRKKKLPQEAAALAMYRAVYCKKYYVATKKFSNRQITQVYQSLLSTGNARSPEAWQIALKLESVREKKFIMGTMTNTTRRALFILMNIIQLRSSQWYLVLDILLKLRKHLRINRDIEIEVPFPEEYFESL